MFYSLRINELYYISADLDESVQEHFEESVNHINYVKRICEQKCFITAIKWMER